MRGSAFDRAQAAKRHAQDSLDAVQRGKSAVTRRNETGDDVNRRNAEIGKGWGNAKRNPKG